MLGCVQKHHQSHLFTRSIDDEINVIIVFLLELVHFTNETGQIVYLNIGLNLRISILGEVSEQNSLCIDNFLFLKSKTFEETSEHIHQILTILFGGQTIVENPHILMVPQSQQLFYLQNMLRRTGTQTLEDSPDISQVKCVVGLRGGW